jgi:hypothetical protein
MASRSAPLALRALPLCHPTQPVQTALRRATSCCRPLGVLPQGRCHKVVCISYPLARGTTSCAMRAPRSCCARRSSYADCRLSQNSGEVPK